MYLRLPISLAVIFGSFTLGLYVAIQGPTLMDLIDLLHINNDIMSYSLAFASLAYSVGGLLSGFLFNYVNRQVLIVVYFLIFGVSNIVTPFVNNYMIFSVITVFKMMCAGGTDCGANVWILEMWPGQDAWLQALHFSFAVGCALGPLIVEPFLSVEDKDEIADRITGKPFGATTISDQNNETRIHIPYAVSGLTSILAALLILQLYIMSQRREARLAKLANKQQAAAGENILLSTIMHPAAVGAISGSGEEGLQVVAVGGGDAQAVGTSAAATSASQAGEKRADGNVLTETAHFVSPARATSRPPSRAADQAPQPPPSSALQQLQQLASPSDSAAAQAMQQLPPPVVKITSKARDQQVEGRPPYYVMFAIALAALCLSSYCGIEITSMNYLATFAVNIDLQISKSTAALMSSALTISFAVGRGFGIWIASFTKPHKLFYLCSGVMAAGNILMLIFANSAEMLLWFSICLFGVGCGPMFPAIVSFYDDRISKVTNTVSGIFILGSMFNVALNSLIIGHHIIDNALILIVCNLVGSVLLLFLFGTLHMLTAVKKNQRVKKYRLRQLSAAAALNSNVLPVESSPSNQQSLAEQQVALLAPSEEEQQEKLKQQLQPTSEGEMRSREGDKSQEQEQQQPDTTNASASSSSSSSSPSSKEQQSTKLSPDDEKKEMVINSADSGGGSLTSSSSSSSSSPADSDHHHHHHQHNHNHHEQPHQLNETNNTTLMTTTNQTN